MKKLDEKIIFFWGIKFKEKSDEQSFVKHEKHKLSEN